MKLLFTSETMKAITAIVLLSGAVRAAPALNSDSNKPQPFSVPNLLNLIPRTLEISEKRKGWLYGTFPFGVAPYPSGKLADKTIADQRAIWAPPVFELGGIIVQETAQAVETVIAVSRDHFLGLSFPTKLPWKTYLLKIINQHLARHISSSVSACYTANSDTGR